MSGRLAYLCLQATTEGQASYAHVHEIIAGLERRGWTVDLFEPAYASGAAPGALGRVLASRRVQRRLIETLRGGGYDALYVRGHVLNWPAARAARRLGIPVAQECNGPYDDLYTMWPATRPFRLVFDALTRWQFRHADAVIAVTDELAAWIERETGRAADVIGNGANIDVFRPGAPAPEGLDLPQRYAVFFGALSPWQGIDLALDAVGDAAWPDDVSLVFVGDGVMRSAIDAAAEGDSRIRALGTQPYVVVPRVVAGAVCSLVLSARPSGFTGSPLKLFESMACGVPVIVADVPATAPLVLEHECGLVVSPGDSRALAEAVSHLLADPNAARAMGARGRGAVEAHYSWDARAAATDEILERVVRCH